MGKIIKNDKVYSGTFDDATSVNYDNSVSGLNANSVQEAIDELADGLKNTSPVDNLLSTSTTLPLSANQGRILNESLSPIAKTLTFQNIVPTRYQCYKIGKLCYLTFYFGAQSVDTQTKIIIPSDMRTSKDYTDFTALTDVGGNLHRPALTKNGEISFTLKANCSLSGSLVWVAN